MNLEKIDSREVYNEIEVDCDCNGEQACNECIDGGLYEGSEVQLPPFIIEPWNEEDERAMHALMHCEDEGACRFCNPEPPSCDGTNCDCNDNVRRGPF